MTAHRTPHTATTKLSTLHRSTPNSELDIMTGHIASVPVCIEKTFENIIASLSCRLFESLKRMIVSTYFLTSNCNDCAYRYRGERR